MKILLATTSHLSAVLIKGQGKWLKNQGHEVIFSSSFGRKVNELITEEKVIFERINFSREINIVNDFYCLLQCVRILKKHKPDVVNAGTPKAGLLFMVASWLCGTKNRVFTLRGLRSTSLIGSKKKIVRFFEVISCRCANKIIVISPSLRDEAIKIKLVNKPSKMVVLGIGSSNGVNLEHFTINDKIKRNSFEIQNRLSLDEYTFKFGYIGRLVKDKGVEELIDAFMSLKNRSPRSIALILVGKYEKDNGISEIYKNIIKNEESIIEIGYSNEIPCFANIIDVLVLPSYREGFGNVVIEAAAMKTPAIVSNIPGACDTIENGVTGILVQPKSIIELEKAMNRYLNDKELVKQHGENGRTRVENFFDNKFIWEEQEKIYKQLKS